MPNATQESRIRDLEKIVVELLKRVRELEYRNKAN